MGPPDDVNGEAIAASVGDFGPEPAPEGFVASGRNKRDINDLANRTVL
jgi:hypothetical protein